MRSHAVIVQEDGKLVVAGVTVADEHKFAFAVARFDPDGSLDDSFGTLGKTITSFGNADWATALLIQPDGKFVVGGSALSGHTRDFALARYESK